MDDIARYNQQRWDALVRAGVKYSRPWYDLDIEALRAQVDPFNLMGDLKDKDVLCLAGGGGQQGPAFARLGARPVVFDLSGGMLESDRQAAARMGIDLRIEQGDMRDLSRFADASFDIVWQAYSINFVPDPLPVFREAARVLRQGGLYHFDCQNPYIFNIDESDWTGEGYLIRYPYQQGRESLDQTWDVTAPDGSTERVAGPREFLHTISTIVSGPAQNGLRLLALHEQLEEADGQPAETEPIPGTWEHLINFMPFYISSWWKKEPG